VFENQPRLASLAAFDLICYRQCLLLRPCSLFFIAPLLFHLSGFFEGHPFFFSESLGVFFFCRLSSFFVCFRPPHLCFFPPDRSKFFECPFPLNWCSLCLNSYSAIPETTVFLLPLKSFFFPDSPDPPLLSSVPPKFFQDFGFSFPMILYHPVVATFLKSLFPASPLDFFCFFPLGSPFSVLMAPFPVHFSVSPGTYKYPFPWSIYFFLLMVLSFMAFSAFSSMDSFPEKLEASQIFFFVVKPWFLPFFLALTPIFSFVALKPFYPIDCMPTLPQPPILLKSNPPLGLLLIPGLWLLLSQGLRRLNTCHLFFFFFNGLFSQFPPGNALVWLFPSFSPLIM